ncbi:MAG: S46 family peptidase [Salibacteraceae bacterium]
MTPLIRIACFYLIVLCAGSVYATEGMWVPNMIKQLVGDEMQAMGMKISPEDLYAVNSSSIKDAVVHFNGGCTSVLVSDKGLLLTNHHCGYSRIAAHSSLENNYLEDGFWAESYAEELANPNMTASIIKEIRDVSDIVFKDFPENPSEIERAKLLKERIAELTESIEEETGFSAYVKPFYHGNQYLLFITEVFQDIRLVGAPPSSIGKYGFDTDNWVWPRHTGDFSVFRIYASEENKPAPYSEENQPYKPQHVLPVSVGGVNEDDFTIVYGFPGRTENFITSTEVKQVLDYINPLRIQMREASLSIIDEAMAQDELTKIQYAAKQSRISNAYKKWIGQSKGLKRHHAVEKKDSLEALFEKRIAENEAWQEKYGGVLLDISSINLQSRNADISRQYFIEFYFMGPEVLRFSGGFKELIDMCKDESTSEDEIQEWVNKKLEGLGFFNNYQAEIDEAIMKAQIGYFMEAQNEEYFTMKLKKKKESLAQFVDRIYEESMFVEKDRLVEFLSGFKRKDYKKIEDDLAYAFSKRVYDHYFALTQPVLLNFVPKKDSLMRVWMEAQREVLHERTYYPDANGTLRITFGKVEGYVPFDGAEYLPYTTLEGVIAKEDPNNPEYNLPPRLKELYEAKDYGQYADESGEMRVCFIASNHTSGGNSGSPVINDKGELIGLNFDRTWESTMSDIMFNPTICRNITVDIRYVLFIMDKFAGADHLVSEMNLVKE